ncbi:hypothetical protein R3P38DRAFT_2958611 [Favolaschia claudopus]|uniref:F-box domain-containing protein n=1 Tax=Favolaschia claudopus TaxID=2862362 RepID=A0AAW0BC27_9AGAR
MERFKFDTLGIHERLRNNDVPLDTEAIRNSIDIAQTCLDTLQNQRLQLQNQLLLLDSETRSLSSYIPQCSSLLAPIRRLPVDILRMIFLDPTAHEPRPNHETDWLPSYYPSIPHHWQYKPNKIGAVCYHWRCVTLEMPILWSGITVFFNRPRPYSNSIDRLRIALQRSQNALLNIAFRTGDRLGYKPWSPHDDEMMLEVLQHAERWATMDLPMEQNFLLQLSPAQGRLEALHSLTVRYSHSFDSTQTAVLSIAPRLRTLTIRGWAYKNMLPSLPWCQVTRLYLDSAIDSPNLWQHILSQAQDLRDLSLHIGHVREAPYVAIVSPHLENFFLFGPSYDLAHEIEILHRITAPALNHLHVVNLKFWDTPPMLGFIKRSGFSLQTLVFYRVPVRGIDLIPILRAVPTVQNLLLEDLIPNAITNSVMEALTANPATAETLLPAMSTFVLVGAYLFGQGNLLTMLESRLTLPNLLSLLTNVEISLPKLAMSPVALRRLDAMCLATTSFRFAGIDQNQRTAVVKYGDDAPHIASIREQGRKAKEMEFSYRKAR